MCLRPAGHIPEDVHLRNRQNRKDSAMALHSVGGGKAVEYYFASDAR